MLNPNLEAYDIKKPSYNKDKSLPRIHPADARTEPLCCDRPTPLTPYISVRSSNRRSF